MADRNDTREQSRLEQTIEAERSKLLQASAVQKCLYEVLLYADGEDAIQYAEAAHVVSTLIDDSVARLDLVRLRPQIEELKRGSKPSHKVAYQLSSGFVFRPRSYRVLEASHGRWSAWGVRSVQISFLPSI